MKRITFIIMLLVATLGVAACDTAADVTSRNLSVAAEQFEIDRRIVFFNGITDTYLMTIEGRCSIEADGADVQLEVTCKTGPDEYKKHFLGLSDNVSYFVEQTTEANASEYNYRVIFRPSTIVPDVDVETP